MVRKEKEKWATLGALGWVVCQTFHTPPSQERPLDCPYWRDLSWMNFFFICIKGLNVTCLGHVQIKGWASVDVRGIGIFLLTCHAAFIPQHSGLWRVYRIFLEEQRQCSLVCQHHVRFIPLLTRIWGTAYLWAKESAQLALFTAPLLWLPHVHGLGRFHIKSILHSACGWISSFASAYLVLLDLAAPRVMTGKKRSKHSHGCHHILDSTQSLHSFSPPHLGRDCLTVALHAPCVICSGNLLLKHFLLCWNFLAAPTLTWPSSKAGRSTDVQDRIFLGIIWLASLTCP